RSRRRSSSPAKKSPSSNNPPGLIETWAAEAAVASYMQWLTSVPSFPFMRYRRVALTGSAIVSAICVLSLFIFGFNLGLDFKGGVIAQVKYSSEADLDSIRTDLEAAGFPSPQVQIYGTTSEVLIRLPPLENSGDPAQLEQRLLDILRAKHPDATMAQPIEFVDGQVGADFAEKGVSALAIALLLIFVYVMVRFQWKLAVGAIIATMHDITVVVGAFSLFQWQFDLTVLGAVLAVLGWSLNDTVVVYDRIRDNLRGMRRGSPADIVDASVNQTLSRTIMTGVTTLLVVVALWLLGGETLWGFSVALIIGIIVGTYSSIYVASAMALVLKVTPADLVVQKRREIDEMP
ncbi:MAG TPA: protein translocase subunit SecF, partial [Gammaproteobacteria bacterium]|nr:protein translocase subunit SecF [Gammaproteobacteria bacterium]